MTEEIRLDLIKEVRALAKEARHNLAEETNYDKRQGGLETLDRLDHELFILYEEAR